MKKFHSLAYRLFSLMAVIGLFSVQGAALARQPEAQPAQQGRPERFKPVSDEIKALFAGGMSAAEFIELSGGRVPNALQAQANRQVTVIVEMEGETVAAVYARAQESLAPAAVDAQQAQRDANLNAQAPVANQVQAAGGQVLAQYTKVYNGLLVRVGLDQLAALQAMPGVKSIRRAPLHVPALAENMDHIRATQVVDELGFDGSGVRIAVIDTGVDYTHAALGGSGDPLDYENNDPDVLEPGDGFPNAKVIGGWDFAGADYDADSDDPAINTPNPDDDPLDGNGHGTHVASTAAGLPVSGEVGQGAAPAASIYALKVFGDSGSTNLTMNAIEWAIDPDGDGDLSDHVDVINMSLGSSFGVADPLDAEIQAVEYASQVGVVVVASAGNSGDTRFITGTPGASDSAISVAASTYGFVTGPTITVTPTPDVSRSEFMYNPSSFDEPTARFDAPLTAPLAYVGALFGGDDTLCDISAVSGTPLAGQIALIQRGACSFEVKVDNAATLGAVAAIIFNSAAGGETLINMSGAPSTIPAGFVGHTDGTLLALLDGDNITISAEDDFSTIADPYTPADTIADFSSRGPRSLDSSAKPDVAAPGVGIWAAAMGGGTSGTSMSGTSMAAPHVAGVAALVREAHPDWVPQQVKAAIMNTAVDLAAGSRAVPRQGAGRVDAYRAVTTSALAIGDEDQVSLNWGAPVIGEDVYNSSKTILLHELFGGPSQYDVAIEWGEGSLTDGVELSAPSTLDVISGSSFGHLSVDLLIDATQAPVGFMDLEEYYGFIVLTPAVTETAAPTATAESLRVPFYVAPRPYSDVTPSNLEFEGADATLEIHHQGPAAADLTVYPLYDVSENEPEQHDQADLRMLGMDFGFTDPDEGDVFIQAINVYGAWFTPQNYFVEFDQYVDIDEDGVADFINYNWNLGAAGGGDDTDEWVVVQYDPSSGTLVLASPFLIYTDYNSGYMEWALPGEWNGLDETNTDFNWQMVAWDDDGNSDVSDEHNFDIAHPIFAVDVPQNPGPSPSVRDVTISVSILDQAGIDLTQPLGMMLVDYNGKPGTGQAYALTPTNFPGLIDFMGINFPNRFFLPVVSQNTAAPAAP